MNDSDSIVTIDLAEIALRHAAVIRADEECERADRALEEAEDAARRANDAYEAQRSCLRHALAAWRPTSLHEVFTALSAMDGVRGLPIGSDAVASNGHALLIVHGLECKPFCSARGRVALDAGVIASTIENLSSLEPTYRGKISAKAFLSLVKDDPVADPREHPPAFLIRVHKALLGGELVREWAARLSMVDGEDVSVITAGPGNAVQFKGAGWRSFIMPRSEDGTAIREFPT